MQEWTARASELLVLILFASKMALKMQIYLDSGPQGIFSVVSCKTGSGTRKVIGKYLIQNNLVQIRMLLERMLEFLKIHSWISKLHLDLRKDFHKQSLSFFIADCWTKGTIFWYLGSHLPPATFFSSDRSLWLRWLWFYDARSKYALKKSVESYPRLLWIGDLSRKLAPL